MASTRNLFRHPAWRKTVVFFVCAVFFLGFCQNTRANPGQITLQSIILLEDQLALDEKNPSGLEFIPSAFAGSPAEISYNTIERSRRALLEEDSFFVPNAHAAKTAITTEMLSQKMDQALELMHTHLPMKGWELAIISLLFFYKKLFKMLKSIVITSLVGIFLVTFLMKNTTILQDTKAQLKELVNSVISSSLNEHMDRLKNGVESPELKRAKDLAKDLRGNM